MIKWTPDKKKRTWSNGQPEIRINFIYKGKKRGYIYRVGDEHNPWFWDHSLREFVYTLSMRPFPNEQSIKNTVEYRVELPHVKEQHNVHFNKK